MAGRVEVSPRSRVWCAGRKNEGDGTGAVVDLDDEGGECDPKGDAPTRRSWSRAAWA